MQEPTTHALTKAEVTVIADTNTSATAAAEDVVMTVTPQNTCATAKAKSNSIHYRKSFSVEDFTEESQMIISEFICSLCQGVYDNPTTDNCGHVFCKACISEHVKQSHCCPLSKEKMEEDDLRPIKFVETILQKQIIQCKNKYYNCHWVGKLSELHNHINNDCERQVIPCPHSRCDLNIFREDLCNHLLECNFRIVPCAYCKLMISYVDKIPHHGICPKYHLPCPQLCKSYIARSEIPIHVKIFCPNTVIDCPYKSHGCEDRLLKKDLNGHLSKKANEHSLMVLDKISSFSDTYSNKINSVEKNVEMLDKSIQNLSMSITLNNKMILEQIDAHIEDKLTGKKRGRLGDTATGTSEEISAANPLLLSANSRASTAYNKENIDGIAIQDLISDTDESKSTHLESSSSVFDSKFVPDSVIIDGNTARLRKDCLKGHRFVLLKKKLNKNQKWTVVLNSSNWIGIGACERKKIAWNKTPLENLKEFGHGVFMLSTNGYIWNSNEPLENNIQVDEFVGFKARDKVTCEYIAKEGRLTIKGSNGLDVTLSSVMSKTKRCLVPCVVLLYPNEEIEIL